MDLKSILLYIFPLRFKLSKLGHSPIIPLPLKGGPNNKVGAALYINLGLAYTLMNDFENAYGLDGDQLSFLSYDLLGLVYFLIYENDFNISKKIFYKKNKFKGKIGIFEINKNIITHQLNFYSVEDNQFKKIF